MICNKTFTLFPEAFTSGQVKYKNLPARLWQMFWKCKEATEGNIDFENPQ